MSISLVRIDDRLIHGQIVEGWLRAIRADKILIISDTLSQNEREKVLFSLAVPPGISVDCLSITEGIEKLKSDYYRKNELLILAEGPREILALLEGGVRLQAVNVGGLHHAPGKAALTDALYLSREDSDALEKIALLGTKVEGRVLPNDKRVDIIAEIKKARLKG